MRTPPTSVSSSRSPRLRRWGSFPHRPRRLRRLGASLLGAHLLGLAGWLALGAGPAAAEEWRAVPVPVEDDLHHITFVGPDRGWITTHSSGEVLRTVDGGRSWRVVASLGEGFLETLLFLDAETGWLVGDRGRLLHTRDGGETWEARGTPDGALRESLALYGIAFLDSERGLATGIDVEDWKGVLYRTEDAGRSWLPVGGEWGRGLAEGIEIIAGRIVVGGRGALFRSPEGDPIWERVELVEGVSIRGVAFADARRGAAAGSRGYLALTFDGGASWRQIEAPSVGLLRDLMWLGSGELVIAGQADGKGQAVWRGQPSEGGATAPTWRARGEDWTDVHRLAQRRTGSGVELWTVGKSGRVRAIRLDTR